MRDPRQAKRSSTGEIMRSGFLPSNRCGYCGRKPILLYTDMFKAMKNKYPIGILGATGMVGNVLSSFWSAIPV